MTQSPDWKQRQVSQQMGPEKERLMHKFKVELARRGQEGTGLQGEKGSPGER